MDIVIHGLLIGIIATIGMDIWAAVAKHGLHLPTADWALVGRWFGHLPRGVFFHAAIAGSPKISHELTIGWVAHYCTGMVYGVAYLSIVQLVISTNPSLASALVFGLVTLIAPWLVLQPGMGAGAFASKTPRPGLMRLVNVSMHGVFGTCLYIGWLLTR